MSIGQVLRYHSDPSLGLDSYSLFHLCPPLLQSSVWFVVYPSILLFSSLFLNTWFPVFLQFISQSSTPSISSSPFLFRSPPFFEVSSLPDPRLLVVSSSFLVLRYPFLSTPIAVPLPGNHSSERLVFNLPLVVPPTPTSSFTTTRPFVKFVLFPGRTK